jgi:hypothetical protein
MPVATHEHFSSKNKKLRTRTLIAGVAGHIKYYKNIIYFLKK